MLSERSISLSSLFIDLPVPVRSGEPDETRIRDVVADSRKVKPGDLFIALSGGSTDGHRFIDPAIQSGAAAVVGEQPLEGLSVPYICVENSRRALAFLSAALYNNPARKLTMIGVTGTDGKTTTCNLIYRVLLAAGIKAGLISTMNAVIGDQLLDTGFHVTTPDAPDVQRYLALMVDAGLTHVVLETTSHGLAQYRVDACEFDIGVVTNITHEHLDFHGGYDEYRAAKARLFTSLGETRPKKHGNIGLAVLNRDDRSYEYLHPLAGSKQSSYGFDERADVRAVNPVLDAGGINFTVAANGLRVGISSTLVGAFNISNCLAALTTAAVGLRIDVETVASGIASLPGVPGRMERIDLGQDFTAIVDFAHTPNALKVSLEAARAIVHASSTRFGNGRISPDYRVIAVFGSAGLRDKEKRRMMAEISAELADLTILTAEDPRTESLNAILAEMAEGASTKGGVEGQSFWRIPDRGEAIRFAVRLAQPGDIVLACGKGHEQSMCFINTEYPWDDRVAMRAALAETLGQPGPSMPYLPTQESNYAD